MKTIRKVLTVFKSIEFPGTGICALFLFLLPCMVFSQPQILWQHVIGGSGVDFGRTICAAQNGKSYYVAGYTYSNDGDIDTLRGGSDIIVARIGNSGNLMWVNSFGGTANEFSYTVIPSSDGGAVIGGFSGSDDGDLPANFGGFDIWIFKIDSNGTLLWSRNFGGSDDEGDHFVGLTNTADNGYALTSNTRSSDGDIVGSHGDNEGWVAKLDSMGQLEWSHCYGSSGDDCSHVIAQAPDGGYYVAGHTSGNNDGDISGLHGDDDAWLFRISDTGLLKWSRCFGGSDAEFIKGIRISQGKFVYFNGATASDDGDIVGLNGGWDMWAGCVDSSGTLLWQHPLGGSLDDFGITLAEDFDSGSLLIGSSRSDDGDLTSNLGSADVWIVKLDTAGNIVWNKNVGGSEFDDGESVIATANNGLVVTGFTYSSDGDVVSSHGMSEMWVVGFGCALPSAAFIPDDTAVCIGTQINFINTTDFYSNSQWFINGVVAGNGDSLNHVFLTQRYDSITLISSYGLCADTVLHIISVNQYPVVDLGNDTLICSTCTIILDAGNAGATFFWSTSDTVQTISLNHTDTVWVTVTNNGCMASDTIIVLVDTLTAIAENDEGKFGFYPNPSTDRIIVFNVNNSPFHVDLLLPDGRLIRTAGPFKNKSEVEVADLPEGIYLLRIINHADGKHIKTFIFSRL